MNKIIFFNLLVFCNVLYCQLFINEIDYDQAGSDYDEFIEIAGPEGTYSNVVIEFINGNNNGVYQTININSLIISNQINGYGFHLEYIEGIQNGAPDGVQLSVNGSIVDAVSYEGTLYDTDGNIMEEIGEDYQISGEENQSLSRSGLDGSLWAEAPITPGQINANQSINIGGNISPYSNAGLDQAVEPGELVTLDGSDSFDSDGEIVSFLWEQASGIDVMISNSDEVIAEFIFPEVSETTELIFELTVIDDEGAVNSDEISISYILYDEITIAEARNLGINQEIMINGVVTSPNFQSSGSEYTIQDSTAGIVLYGAGITDLDLSLGDNVIVAGVTDEYNGKFEIIINSSSDVDILGTVMLPDPHIITVEELYLNGEIYESQLVTINNVMTEDSWPNEGSSANLVISDGSGAESIMRIDSDTEIDGSLEPNWPVAITGVAGQYDSSSPYNSGYQILPRYYTDFQGVEGMPIANAGLDQMVEPGALVTLDGSNSFDSNGQLLAYEWVQTSGHAVILDNEDSIIASFTAPDVNDILKFNLTVWDDEINQSTDEISISIINTGLLTLSDIINNCGEDMGESIECDGQYDLSIASASECPLYENQVITRGVIVDYFDITPFNGPHSFTIEDEDGLNIDFVIWPESSTYQDGFDITQTDLNLLTQSPFGMYEVQIVGKLGAYCDDDEMLNIDSEWQITVEYEDNIFITNSLENNDIILPLNDLLHANFPNPFNPVTNIIFDLKNTGNVELSVYDINGSFIINLINEVKAGGKYSIYWDAKDRFGNSVPSGLYFCKMTTINNSYTNRMLLVR